MVRDADRSLSRGSSAGNRDQVVYNAAVRRSSLWTLPVFLIDSNVPVQSCLARGALGFPYVAAGLLYNLWRGAVGQPGGNPSSAPRVSQTLSPGHLLHGRR